MPSPPAPLATVAVGGRPALVAVAPDGHRAYVADRDSDTLVVIDTAVNLVVTSIPLPFHTPMGVAVAPDGRHAYVTGGAESLCAVDTSTDSVGATFS